MSVMRSVLLAGAESRWLRQHATRHAFVRRSVSRFMPGETMEAALEASRRQQRDRGTATILTRLGENVRSTSEAEAVTRHYLELMESVHDLGLDAHLSVKLTQLGLDLGPDTCRDNLLALIERADALGNMIWIDMESSAYVDRTLALFRRARARSHRVGVCLQAYLRRTTGDLESLLPLAPSIRLVKGAYREAPQVAFARKADVDQNYERLADRLLQPGLLPGTFLGIGTHDGRIVDRLRALIDRRALARTACEFEMLYGIQRPLQERLVREGRPLRILISYGDYWFPWFMRRLAERPANVVFVMKSVFGR